MRQRLRGGLGLLPETLSLATLCYSTGLLLVMTMMVTLEILIILVFVRLISVVLESRLLKVTLLMAR